MMPKTSSGRWLAGIVAAVALLAAVSIGVTLVAGGDVQELPEGSPERAVQDYLLAAQDRDYIIAYDYFAPEVQAQCSLEDYRQSISPEPRSSIRIRLDSVRPVNGETEVAIRLTTIYMGDPFPSEHTTTYHYRLREVDGDWRLLTAPWPWNRCGNRWDLPMTPTPAEPSDEEVGA